jgi:hypothetical protein
MKITKNQLRQIIKEELAAVLDEQDAGPLDPDHDPRGQPVTILKGPSEDETTEREDTPFAVLDDSTSPLSDISQTQTPEYLAWEAGKRTEDPLEGQTISMPIETGSGAPQLIYTDPETGEESLGYKDPVTGEIKARPKIGSDEWKQHHKRKRPGGLKPDSPFRRIK